MTIKLLLLLFTPAVQLTLTSVLQIPLPSKPQWYLLFGATEDEIKEVCVTTLRLYTRKKVSCVL